MSRKARIRSLVLCFALLVIIPALAAAQPEPPRLPPPLPPEMMPSGDPAGADGRVFPPSLLPYLPADTLSLPAASADPVPQARSHRPHGQEIEGDWHRVAFYAYLNGSYELFTIREVWGNRYHIRLTDSAAIEVQPTIGPDGAHIAYASNADGDFDLYIAPYNYVTETIGPPVKLTHNSYNEYWPVWSPDGKKLAFHGLIGEQSEIFVINADGSGLTNLTNHPAGDGYPTWSPDGSKIAFSSTRTGGYRIHVMNANGSNVSQLSNQMGGLYPAWSPDGKTIAYSADNDQDGWLELMMMNADGKDQKSLAFPVAKTDYEVRGWSPNGESVTYTNVNYILYSGQWYIESAGLSAYKPWRNEFYEFYGPPYSFAPHWSSIDSRPPQTAVLPLPAESPGRFTLRWGGGDVGPAGLDVYDVQMQTNDGPWVDLYMETTYIEMQEGGIGGNKMAFRSRGRDYAGNVEPWPAAPDAVTTIESKPPVSFMNPISPYTQAGEPLELSWGGNDVGSSGLASFEVQFRLNNEAWQPWLPGMTYTYVTFAPNEHGVKPGDRVDFRIRGKDFAQNVEAWRSNPDASTTYYSRSVSGQVIDNTGVPVGGATAGMDPAALGAVTSDRDGRYIAYIGAPVSVAALDWAKTGYGALPPMARTLGENRRANPVLPPADNALVNGDFEAADWGAWQPSGSIAPTLLADATEAHSGERAAALAERALLFGPTVRVSNTIDSPESAPTVTLDGDGNAFVLWLSGGDALAMSLYSTTRRADGTWTDAGLLRGGVRRYDVARGPDGMLHLAVVAVNGVSLYRQAGDGWSAAEPVPGTAEASYVTLEIGPDGRFDLVWSDFWKLHHNYRAAGGSWSTAFLISGVEGQTSQHEQQLARTPDGALHLVWNENDYNVYHRRLSPSGTWGNRSTLGIGYMVYFDHGIGLGVDGAGRLHAGWLYRTDNGTVEIVSRTLNGTTWEPAKAMWQLDDTWAYPQGWGVSPDGAFQVLVQYVGGLDYVRREADGLTLVESLPANLQNPAAMTVDASGTAHVAFTMSDANSINNVFYTTRTPAGDWLEPFNLSRHSRYSYGGSLTADSQGNVYAVWLIESEKEGYYGRWPDVSFAAPSPAAEDGESVLSQVVAVPAGMAHPVLSFVYQSGGVLLLELEDPGDERAATWSGELPPSPAGMRHHWLDLSDYSGEEVRITFRLERTAGAPVTWAIIDDVSVGAAHTDIDVSGQSGGRLANDTVIHTLRVSNGSALAAGDVTLTYTLPPALSFVSADPVPAGLSPLRWQLGTLAAGTEITIRITTAVTTANPPHEVVSAAAVTTTGAELELMNNSAEVVTLLERWVALPVVIRN